jgi:hypothetical protein
MAASIDVQWVSAVLLADGWHIIQPGTFRIEEYQFASDDPDDLVVPAQKGYAFSKVDQLTRNLQHYVGPLSYVLSVRYDVPTELVDE